MVTFSFAVCHPPQAHIFRCSGMPNAVARSTPKCIVYIGQNCSSTEICRQQVENLALYFQNLPSVNHPIAIRLL